MKTKYNIVDVQQNKFRGIEEYKFSVRHSSTILVKKPCFQYCLLTSWAVYSLPWAHGITGGTT